MKHLLLVLGLALATVSTASAQEFGDYIVFNSEKSIYIYTTGEGISNSTKNPDLTLHIDKDGEGTFRFRLDGVQIYKYNEGKNYVDFDVIVDKNPKLSFGSNVIGLDGSTPDAPKTRLRAHNFKNGDSQADMIKQMKNGEQIYVQTTGGGKPKVFKFSASGFTAAMEQAIEYLNTSDDNPFASTESDNPF